MSSKSALPLLLQIPDSTDWDALDDAEFEAFSRGLTQLSEVVSKIATKRSGDRIDGNSTPENAKSDKVASTENSDPETQQTLSGDKDTTKRTYLMQRAKHELPDPSQPSDAEINRAIKKITVRLSSTHLDMFNEVSEAFFTKREAMEAAIELLVASKLENDL